MKPIKTSKELVDYLEEKKVAFDINYSKEEAIDFLKKKNYYMKLFSYRRNYNKDPNDNYMNLDFSHMVDLSTIDMHLRYLIMKMCLDIEHSLKVQLLQAIELEDEENGYEIVRQFLNYKKNHEILKELSFRVQSGSYAKELIEKHHPYYPIWVFVEVISFGNLTYLCHFYNKRCQERGKKNHFLKGNYNNKILNNIRDIRNASAHNNCLIYDLKSTRYKYDRYIKQHKRWSDIYELNKFLIENNFTKSIRKSRLSNRFIKDFTCLLYGYNIIIPESNLKIKRLDELRDLMENRMLRNKDFYANIDTITSSYNFIYDVLNVLS